MHKRVIVSFCHFVIHQMFSKMANLLAIKMELNKILCLTNWAFFNFQPYLSENFSVSGSSYGQTQHFGPGKLN